jgi:hypothetical protein
VARFLSPEWFAEVATPDPEPVLLTIRQVVTGGPDGEVRYAVRVGHDGRSIAPGEPADADVTFTESWETAEAIARGDLAPQRAFADGRLRVEGDVRLLPAVLGRLSAE